MQLERGIDRVQPLDLLLGVAVRASEICDALLPVGEPRVGRYQAWIRFEI